MLLFLIQDLRLILKNYNRYNCIFALIKPMKRILFILLLFTSYTSSSQIYNTSVNGVNCYTDSGSVFLDIIAQSIEWQYTPHNSNNWQTVSSLNTPFVQLNTTLDTIKTINCGKFKIIYSYFNGIQTIMDSSLFSISCPLTMGQAQPMQIQCFGDSSGILERPVFGGSPFLDNLGIEYYYYEWIFSEDSLGTNSFYFSDTTSLIGGVSSGWYKTIVTDSIGCKDTIGFIEIKDPPKLIVDTTFKINVKCNLDNNGVIGFHISGGKKYDLNNKYFYYLIFDGDTIGFSDTSGVSSNFSSIPLLNLQSYYKDSIQFDSLFSGEYILSIVDSFGCVLNDTFSLTAPLPYQTYISPSASVLCEGDSGTFYIDSVVGGTNPYYYYYGFVQNGFDTINIETGYYEVFIHDSTNLCFDTLTAYCPPIFDVEGFATISNVVCYGENSGSIIFDSIVGGNIPYDVQWGSVDNFNLLADTYDVSIVDSIGCIHNEQFTVTQPNQIQPNAVLYPPSCFGMSDGSIVISPSGGNGLLNYFWLNGTGTNDSLYGLTSGVYSLVISDESSCTDTFIIILNSPQILDVSVSIGDSILTCTGETTLININVLGGTPPYLINWNDGNTDQQRIVGAGYYSAVITDDNGCTDSVSFTITEPDSIHISVDYTNISCNTFGTASVSSVGGTQPISYFWSTGETTQTIDSLWGTVYWLIATDSCGNSDSIGFDLAPYELETSILYDDLIHIAEVEIGSSSTGGPFSYFWTNIFGDTISFESITLSLCEGVYFATTIDIENGCVSLDTIPITFDLPNGVLNLETTTVLVDSNLWGFAPYTYLWSNGEITQHADVCPGEHWVEVTDVDGCMVREDFTIVNIIITLDPATAIIECNLENLDICIKALPDFGTKPYYFEWWNGETEDEICSEIMPGNHTLIVIDENGCEVDTSFTIATMTSDCVPNVFSPNGDGINDSWSLEDTFLYAESEVRIYGRFGRLFFQSVGYHTPWDGTNENGKDLPDGVYFYHLQIGNGFDPIQGTVTIIR